MIVDICGWTICVHIDLSLVISLLIQIVRCLYYSHCSILDFVCGMYLVVDYASCRSIHVIVLLHVYSVLSPALFNKVVWDAEYSMGDELRIDDLKCLTLCFLVVWMHNMYSVYHVHWSYVILKEGGMMMWIRHDPSWLLISLHQCVCSSIVITFHYLL